MATIVGATGMTWALTTGDDTVLKGLVQNLTVRNVTRDFSVQGSDGDTAAAKILDCDTSQISADMVTTSTAPALVATLVIGQAEKVASGSIYVIGNTVTFNNNGFKRHSITARAWSL